jgi:hypothetical protein
MENQSLRNAFRTLLLVLAVQFALPAISQTFRGGISGTVTDPSGAALPGALVTAVETATNTSFNAVASSAGEFAFTNLPLGDYTVAVSAAGFETVKVTKVNVSGGVSYTLPVKLTVASTAQSVEVTASALALDTETDVQASDIPEVIVQNLPNSGRDFTQMLALNAGFAGYSTGGGALASSVNGTRSNSVNWQIEGTDNNDLWWNIPAVNQSGVNGIAAVLMPIDAIQNFSFVTSGTTEIGRNSGGTANVTIKSGTNQLHGSAYYFNHNEFFQVVNPFESSKQETRNQHYGFSVGGPIRKDKTFFFLSGEKEWFSIGAGAHGTEPSAAYQTAVWQWKPLRLVAGLGADRTRHSQQLPISWRCHRVQLQRRRQNRTGTDHQGPHSVYLFYRSGHTDCSLNLLPSALLPKCRDAHSELLAGV